MSTDKKISWWSPQIGEEEYKLIKKVLDNDFPNEGILATSFEKKIADLLEVKHAIAVTSGTIAIFLSLKALGIKQGDEVILPDLTFVATASAVDLCGAKPIFVDIDPVTLNISTDQLTKAITKKTKVVIPVHVSGRASDMDTIKSIAKDNNIYIVEDAAEALLSKHKGKYLGTFGDLGCFSFSPHKTITTGQGGMIVTNSDKLELRLRQLKDQGRSKRGTGGDDIHDTIGYNFKFTDLQAAVGIGQLSYLHTRAERMKKIHQLYYENLKNIDKLSILKFDINNGESPQWTDVISESRDELDKYLQSHNIECRKFWLPIHTQKPYKLPDDNFPNVTKLSPQAMWLPSCFSMSDEDVSIVCQHIQDFFKK